MDRQEYLELLAGQIRYKRAVPLLLREMEGHMEEQKEDFISEGMTVQEAEAAAVREMGDPVAVGMELDKIHRPMIAWSLLGMAVILSLLGIAIQIAVELSASHAWGNGSLYDLMSGTMLRNQILCVLGGILLMLCICRMDYAWIGKYAVPLWGFLLFLLGEYCVKTPNISGKYNVAWSFACLMVPVFAGVVYHYWGRGTKGLVISIVILLITEVFSIHLLESASTACIVVMTGNLMLGIAVCHEGFGKSVRKKRLCGSILLMASAVFGIGIQEFLKPEQNVLYQNIAAGMKRMVEHTDGISAISSDSPDMLLLKGDYLWHYLFESMGSGVGVALTLAEVTFAIGMLILTIRQRNLLGKMLGMGCVMFFIMQIVMYVGMNMGYIAPVSVYMPFISYGNMNLMITYLYVGLLLSVHYNSHLINN